MDTTIGWLLDIIIEQNDIVDKDDRGSILRLIDKFQPSFYVLPKSEITSAELFHILSQQPKLTDIFENDGYGMRRLLCVYPESIYYYKTFLKKAPERPKSSPTLQYRHIPHPAVFVYQIKG
jgi:hypothetical protein